MKFKSFVVAGFLALSLTACEAAEEPNSFSEQGSSTKVAEADSKAAKGSEDKKADKKPSKPKWQRNMNKVKLGMSMKRVKKLLGKPDDTDASETSVPDMDEETFEVTERTMTMDMWTYGNIITDDSTWVLQFTDGKLDSKSRM
jgi:hypothetical protein